MIHKIRCGTCVRSLAQPHALPLSLSLSLSLGLLRLQLINVANKIRHHQQAAAEAEAASVRASVKPESG